MIAKATVYSGRVKLSETRAADTGRYVIGIALSEPASSHELLDVPCDAGLVESDYRELHYILMSFPKVQVTSYCR